MTTMLTYYEQIIKYIECSPVSTIGLVEEVHYLMDCKLVQETAVRVGQVLCVCVCVCVCVCCMCACLCAHLFYNTYWHIQPTDLFLYLRNLISVISTRGELMLCKTCLNQLLLNCKLYCGCVCIHACTYACVKVCMCACACARECVCL